jgi:sentrin-specific protease 1
MSAAADIFDLCVGFQTSPDHWTGVFLDWIIYFKSNQTMSLSQLVSSQNKTMNLYGEFEKRNKSVIERIKEDPCLDPNVKKEIEKYQKLGKKTGQDSQGNEKHEFGMRKVSIRFGIEVTRHQFTKLSGQNWLCCGNIDFFTRMLQEENEKNNKIKRKSYFAETTLMTYVLDKSSYGYPKAKKLTRKVDVFQQNMLFVPVNINNLHWILVVAYMRDKLIVSYDSMVGKDRGLYRDLVLEFLVEEKKDKGSPVSFEPSEWTLTEGGNHVPKQVGVFDCGVFVCMATEFLANQLPLLYYSQENVSAYRSRMAYYTMRSSLLEELPEDVVEVKEGDFLDTQSTDTVYPVSKEGHIDLTGTGGKTAKQPGEVMDLTDRVDDERVDDEARQKMWALIQEKLGEVRRDDAEWKLRIPKIANDAEEDLYKNAKNMAEYSDLSTLSNRLKTYVGARNSSKIVEPVSSVNVVDEDAVPIVLAGDVANVENEMEVVPEVAVVPEAEVVPVVAVVPEVEVEEVEVEEAEVEEAEVKTSGKKGANGKGKKGANKRRKHTH